jgi:hypothetical protein
MEIIHLTLQGMELTLRVTGSGARDAAAFLETLQRENFRSGGRIRLLQMLRSGEELRLFSLPGRQLRAFSRLARRYGLAYCVRMHQKGGGTAQILTRACDVPRVQRILEQTAAELRKAPQRTEPASPETTESRRSLYEKILHPEKRVREINPIRRPDFGRGWTTGFEGSGGNPLEIPSIRESLEKRLARVSGAVRNPQREHTKGEQTLEHGN